ncbi:MAG: cation-translocating P-type ATPase [Planctomycetota bacterium]|jgi:sodium/potassium-transporting ATPase subunit alpha
MNIHKINLDKLFKLLESSPNGISEKEIKIKREKYGVNILNAKNKEPAILKFLKQFTNFFALLLISGSILAFFAESVSPGEGNLYIGIALIAVVFLNAIFTFIQQYQSEKIMQSFKQMMPEHVQVIREGLRQKVSAKELVPGDIISLSEGDKIPADGRLREENSLKVDNSPLTGESEPQLRKLEPTHENILESRNMVFSGTLVQSGNGKALICTIGMDTQIGKIVKLTKETDSVDTPLHKELNYFIKIISIIAISLGIVFFFVSWALGKPLIGSLIFAIGIIVANVPEGLLPTVTLSLSIASKRMAKRHALIKNLESVETLGSTTVICTDKTGTITENRMSTHTIFLNLKEKNILDKDLDHEKGLNQLLKTMTLCNNARIDFNTKKFTGDPTETALLEYSNTHFEALNLIQNEPRVHECPFDSKTKRMITTNKTGKIKVAHMKGAPEVVIEECNQILIEGKI